jgi:hypothetical protein
MEFVMKTVVAMLMLFMLPNILHAGASLDVIDGKLDTVLDNQDVIINSVENNPLKGKKYGVEFNFFRALSYGLSSDSGYQNSLSGAFSIFDVDNKVEYAFPVFYLDMKDNFDNSTFSVLTLDMQYRKFLGETLNGFFISGLLRAAKLDGTLGRSLFFSSSPAPTVTGSEFKFGAGIGIGYRVFSESGWYWGTSLSAGRYFVGESNKFYSGDPFYDDGEIFFDFDLLKFGYSF